MKKRYQVYGYTSKSGRQGNYKAIATFKKDGQDRVRLQSFGANPVEFWVDRDKLQEPFPIKAKPGAETRQCWECGCEFTWAERSMFVLRRLFAGLALVPAPGLFCFRKY